MKNKKSILIILLIIIIIATIITFVLVRKGKNTDNNKCKNIHRKKKCLMMKLEKQ